MASRPSPSCRQIRMSGTCRITIPSTFGDRRYGEFIRRLYTRESTSGLAGGQASMSVSILGGGGGGGGGEGDGGRIGSVEAFSSTIRSSIVTVMATTTTWEGHSDAPPGRTTPSTGSAYRMAIGTWLAAL